MLLWLVAVALPTGSIVLGGRVETGDVVAVAVAYSRILTALVLLLLARGAGDPAVLAALSAAFGLTGIASAVGAGAALSDPAGLLWGVIAPERLEFSARAALPLGLAFAATAPWDRRPVASSAARAFVASALLTLMAVLLLLAWDLMVPGLAVLGDPDPLDVAAALLAVGILVMARRRNLLWDWVLLAALASAAGASGHILTLDLTVGWYISLGLSVVAASAVLVGVTLTAAAVARDAAVLRVRRRFEERIERLALYDEVTGLPNLHLVRQRIDEALAAGKQVTVVVLALAGLDLILQTFGHDLADGLLRGAADRLGEQVGALAATARVGDEELALLPGDPARGADLAARAVQALDEPILVAGAPLVIGASAGHAVAPRDAADGELLLRRARLAARTARSRGRRTLEYAAGMEPYRADQVRLVSELRGAIGRGELDLYYQPKARVRDRTVVGVEGLVRWRHPARGLLPPAQFIPLAESTYVIDELTRWVIRTAADRAAAWRREGLSLSVAVNLPTRTLIDRELLPEVEEAIGSSGVDPAFLRLEVTESAAMQDIDRGLRRLQALRGLGVGLAIDDFGTGYSSLAYLARLPIDEVKIDATFVRNMTRGAKDATIIRSSIELCHQLGFVATAEGAEDGPTWDALAAMGCDLVQGYVVGRPVPVDQLLPALRAGGWSLPVA